MPNHQRSKPPQADRKRCVLYTRARPIGDSNAVLERQQEAVERWAAEHGYDVTAAFEDHGSAIDRKRPGFVQMLEAIEHGDGDALIVSNLDRLARRRRELAQVVNACRATDTEIVSVREGRSDELMLRIHLAMQLR